MAMAVTKQLQRRMKQRGMCKLKKNIYRVFQNYRLIEHRHVPTAKETPRSLK
jgi:ABC-type ATPase involved in cell division